jgi:hypothetical protein
MNENEIRDPVYGFIIFSDDEKKIIDHPAFQRLRRIKQLGLTDMLYPGATHTRFEHSLGVMHLATRMFAEIVRKPSSRKVLESIFYNEEEDRDLLRRAALLHDIGHGPFSHLSEELMGKNPETGKPFKHEDYTIAIIRGPLKKALGTWSDDIADFLRGNPTRLGLRIFWYQLLSSQLDADRCDYLLRDSLHTGVKYGLYDIERLLVTISLARDPEEEKLSVGLTEGGWYVAESLVIARYHMYEQVYFHKIRRAYDIMLREALIESIGQLPPPWDIDEFLKLDDYTTWNIMKEKNSEWFKMIKERKHLKVVYEEEMTSKENHTQILDTIRQELSNQGIWYWEDSPDRPKSWYGMGNGEEEIYIIKEDKPNRLSEYSPIVKYLKRRMVRRIYVKPFDYERAKNIIKKIREG